MGQLAKGKVFLLLLVTTLVEVQCCSVATTVSCDNSSCSGPDWQNGSLALEDSLNYVANKSNSVVFVLDFEECILTKDIVFFSVNNLTIIGPNTSDALHTSNISCNGNNVGLFFNHCTNIFISNIHFDSCGAKLIMGSFSSVVGLLQATLLFSHCTNITILSVIVFASNGTGLIMTTALASVSISPCS